MFYNNNHSKRRLVEDVKTQNFCADTVLKSAEPLLEWGRK